MATTLDRESKTVIYPVTPEAGMRKVRITPTAAAIIERHRPAGTDKGDFAGYAMLKDILEDYVDSGNLYGLHDLLVELGVCSGTSVSGCGCQTPAEAAPGASR